MRAIKAARLAALASSGRGRTLAALALVVGIGSGLGAIAFRYMIRGFTWVFTGHTELAAAFHASTPFLPGFGRVALFVVPVVGGLLYGPLLSRFAPEARGHGVPEVMLAVSRNGGRIRPRVAIVKSLASALCIGSGGSVGREGPIVQIGSALGSAVGQLTRMPERRVRLLVACGAAGGIAATFNAPIAGVFFALEIILRDFEANSFAVVVLSSVTAAAVGRAAFGSAAVLQLPQFQVQSAGEYLLFAGLGVLAAVAGMVFIRTLYGMEDAADRLWRGPAWARPAVGGVLLGALLFALPQMYGVGYPVLESAVRGHYVIAFLLLLLIGKVVATSLTIAIGGSGGVFAPALFMGAMLGSGYGQALHDAVPGLAGPAGAYGLVGMAAVFAGASRAPITAVLIIFELTGDYGIILPLMVAVGIASGVAALLSRDSIYTLKLRRRGIDLSARRGGSPMQRVTVGAAMQALPPAVAFDLPVAQLVARLSEGYQDALPVIGENGELIGVVSAEDVESRLDVAEPSGIALDFARPVESLRVDEPLEAAAHRLAESDQPGLPVVRGAVVAGWITHRDVLKAYRRGSDRPAPAQPSQNGGQAAVALER